MAVTVIGHVVATSFLLDTSAGRPGRDSAKLSAAEDVQRASVDVYCRQSSRNRHVTTSARLVVCWHSEERNGIFFFPKNQKEKRRMCRRGGRRRAKEVCTTRTTPPPGCSWLLDQMILSQSCDRFSRDHRWRHTSRLCSTHD